MYMIYIYIYRYVFLPEAQVTVVGMLASRNWGCQFEDLETSEHQLMRTCMINTARYK